ncbi:MAG: exonuclease domain-containing protein [Bacteroidota bacterium]|nr:exonuclease domain-containing protein [Bacteroidota bacterium]
MIESFTAIDFETATEKRASVCQLGLVRVENRKIVERISMLVQPPQNLYNARNISIHRIKPADTRNSPSFNLVWKDIRHFISDQNVVAHNGFSVDFHCIDKSLDLYGIAKPEYNKHCTYKIFKKRLPDLCMEHGIRLKHHDALSDAEACAELFMIYLNRNS